MRKKSKKSKKRMMKVVSATMACSILAGSTSLLNVQKVQATETTSAEIQEKNINDVTMNEAQLVLKLMKKKKYKILQKKKTILQKVKIIKSIQWTTFLQMMDLL